MPTHRLDRLAALLEGLAPEVMPTVAGPGANETLANEPTHLLLYLLADGSASLQGGKEHETVRAPALIALRSDHGSPISLDEPADPQHLICLRTRLNGPGGPLFLDEFVRPRIVSLEHDEPALSLAIDLLLTELDTPRCGHAALLSRAGDILLIGLLRHLIANPSPNRHGLFNGLADPRIAKALVAMHHRPDHDWSLERLSQEAGMSRTAFAASFRRLMKHTPGKYLAAIRLAIAQRSVDLGKGLKEAARSSGYRNVSALSRALTRAREHRS